MRLIDADALLEDSKKDAVGRMLIDLYNLDVYINGRPTIEERKKGKWIYHDTENDKWDDIVCPFCKKTFTVDADRFCDIGFIASDFRFCPNCGADMRGEEDE